VRNTKAWSKIRQRKQWKYLVNEHWQQMRNIIMQTAQNICGMSKGPCRHKEMWWNKEVVEAVREKYGNWICENSSKAWKEYKTDKQNAKRVISSAKEKTEGLCK